jgi:hypothetical protein
MAARPVSWARSTPNVHPWRSARLKERTSTNERLVFPCDGHQGSQALVPSPPGAPCKAARPRRAPKRPVGASARRHAERRIRVALAVFERGRDPPKSAPDFDAPVSLTKRDIRLDHTSECADLCQRDRRRATWSERGPDQSPTSVPLLAGPNCLGRPFLRLSVLRERCGERALRDAARALSLGLALRLPIVVSGPCDRPGRRSIRVRIRTVRVR